MSSKIILPEIKRIRSLSARLLSRKFPSNFGRFFHCIVLCSRASAHRNIAAPGSSRLYRFNRVTRRRRVWQTKVVKVTRDPNETTRDRARVVSDVVAFSRADRPNQAKGRRRGRGRADCLRDCDERRLAPEGRHRRYEPRLLRVSRLGGRWLYFRVFTRAPFESARQVSPLSYARAWRVIRISHNLVLGGAINVIYGDMASPHTNG